MNQEKNTYSYPIPGYIQNEIEKKWFYLYEWVDETELKASIERDFLQIFDTFGIPIAIILILPTLIFGLSGGTIMGVQIYISILVFLSILLFFYILFLSISRSHILRHIAFIIITNKYFRILHTIEPIKNNMLYGGEEIQQIWELFEEELFRDSRIKQTKTQLFRKVSDNLLSGYSKIFEWIEGKTNSREEWGQAILLIAALYTVYLLSIGLVYGIWIFFVMILGNIFVFFNRQYLLLRKHKITQISEGFEKIDDYSKNIEQEKKNFLHFLQEAQNNNWIDGLLLKLENSIEDTNFYANKTVDATVKLKKNIKNSQYKDMFDAQMFESWIKTEIITPLQEIQKLLKLNLATIETSIWETQKIAANHKEQREQWAILISKKRLELQKEEIIQLLTQMELYITKLTQS